MLVPAMSWYYVDALRRQVEVREDLLPELVSSAVIRRETLVWNEHMETWRPAGEVLSSLFSGLPPALTTGQRQQLLNVPIGTVPAASVATDPVAVCSLVFGFLGLPICVPIFSIPAIICGHIARKRARQQALASGNSGLALAGLIMGYLGFSILIVFILFYVGMIVVAIVVGDSEMPVGPE